MKGHQIAGATLAVYSAITAIALAAPPPNDNFAGAQLLPDGSSSTSGNNFDATREPGEPSHGDFSVWFRWTPSESGAASIDTCDSDFDTNLSVYTGDSIEALTTLARNDDGFSCSSSGSRVKFAAIAGTTYHIAVATKWEEQGSAVLEVDLDVPVPPGNDDFGQATALKGSSDSAGGTNKNATAEGGEPDHAGGKGKTTVWYRWRAKVGGIVVLDACDSEFDTLLAVYTGSSLKGLKRIASDAGGCGNQSRLSFVAKRGTTYRIALAGRGGDTGRIYLYLDQLEAGRYKGRTEFVDGKQIRFKLTPGGRQIRRFTFSQDLDCFRGGVRVGEFKFKRVWIPRIRVKKTDTGGEFSKRVKTRFRDGGYFTIDVNGTLSVLGTARGRLKVRVSVPGGVTCRNFLFGTVNWKASRG